jgi:hypothetical protein
MEEFSVLIRTDGRLVLMDAGRTYHVNIAGPGVCTCGAHRPGAPCRHIAVARARFLKRGRARAG